MNIDTETLQAILDKGESIEWTGKPEPFKAVNPYNKSSIILRCIISVIVGVALIVLYFIGMKAKGQPAGFILPLIIAGVAAFLCLRPFLDARSLRKRIFIVTDKNAVSYDGVNSHKKLPLDEIDEAVFIDKGNGVGDILLGSPVIKKPYRNIQVTALMPTEDNVGNDIVTTGMAFFNVAGFSKVEALLSPSTKITEKKLSEI